MFRISQYLHALAQPPETSPAAPRKPGGPVVIWNLIRRCNLTCKHCYSISADIDFPGELSTAQVFDVMDDLRKVGVALGCADVAMRVVAGMDARFAALRARAAEGG